MQVSQRLHNNTYAPGIATYGIDGKTGDTGLPGTSMFFTDYDLTTEFNNFTQKITSRMLPLKIKEIVLDRKYVNGDCFVTKNGMIWKLSDINELSLDTMNGHLGILQDYFEHIGNFLNEQQNDLFYDNDSNIRKNKLIITDSENYTDNPNNQALLTLNKINKGIGSVDFINVNALYGNAGNMDLNISYDNTLKAFKLDSQYPIVIDSNLYVKQEADIQQTNQYSPILTTENGITTFHGICNKLNYNIDSSIYSYNKKDSSAVYFGSIYIITLNNCVLLNTLQNTDITLHFQNGNFQDFQLYRESESTYYFKQDYDYVKLNDLISKIIYNDLTNIQLSLIYNLEIYIKKQDTNLIGYKI